MFLSFTFNNRQQIKVINLLFLSEQVYSVLAGEHESEAVRRGLCQKRGGEGIRILRHQKTERDPQTGSDKDLRKNGSVQFSLQVFLLITCSIHCRLKSSFSLLNEVPKAFLPIITLLCFVVDKWKF